MAPFIGSIPDAMDHDLATLRPPPVLDEKDPLPGAKHRAACCGPGSTGWSG